MSGCGCASGWSTSAPAGSSGCRCSCFSRAAGGLKPLTRAGREALAGLELSPAGRELVELALRMIDRIDQELAPLERELADYARRQRLPRADRAAVRGRAGGRDRGPR